MSGHTPKITSKSAREVLKFDADVWGAGLYGKTNMHEFYEFADGRIDINVLSKDILKIYNALRKSSHFHPIIKILQRDMQVVVERLYGTIPKQEWKPEKTEQKLACLIYRKDHGENPTRKEMQKIIDDIKERKFEVK